jgi:hypothetical protein
MLHCSVYHIYLKPPKEKFSKKKKKKKKKLAILITLQEVTRKKYNTLHTTYTSEARFISSLPLILSLSSKL